MPCVALLSLSEPPSSSLSSTQTPAFAAANTICVGAFVGTCDSTVATIPLALTAAGTDGSDSVINIAAGEYTDGPYILNGSASDTLEVHGSGASTVITLPASANNDTYVTLNGAVLTDLVVELEGGPQSPNDSGITANAGSVIDTVIVDGTAAGSVTGVFATGSQVTNSSINVANSSRAIYSLGGNSVIGSSLTSTLGFFAAASQSAPDTLSGLTVISQDSGVTVAGGTVSIDNSLVQIGTGNGVGLAAINTSNNVTPKTLNIDHVTVVGGGAGSEGVRVRSTAPGALQTSTVNLTNSIVRGPATSLAAFASNNGAQGGPSTATLNVSYTDYETTSSAIDPTTGTGGVTLGAGVLTVDPQFAGVGDYHPVTGSPVIDAGNPAAGAPSAVDLEGVKRVQDGNADGIDRRDMGAYELPDTVAPTTTIVSGPSGLTNDATPTFAFTSDPGATFECKVDSAAYAACTSPLTATALGDGAHTFSVRAKDIAGNVGVAAATRAFTVDTIGPDTTIAKKPAKRVTKKKVKLVFSAEAGATFECSVDGKAFKACTSPLKLKVKQGKHVVLVRAVDKAGNSDATPAKVKFKRVAAPKG